MALLDSILGGLLGGGQQNSPMGSILGSLLGGGGGGMSGGGMAGGLGGIVQRMEQAGLGSVAQSWVGSGPNQPVSPQDLQRVFPQQQLDQMSQQSGLSHGDLLSQLSQLLPQAVDHMTPNGQMPAAGGDASDPFSGAGTSNVRV